MRILFVLLVSVTENLENDQNKRSNKLDSDPETIHIKEEFGVCHVYGPKVRTNELSHFAANVTNVVHSYGSPNSRDRSLMHNRFIVLYYDYTGHLHGI